MQKWLNIIKKNKIKSIIVLVIVIVVIIIAANLTKGQKDVVVADQSSATKDVTVVSVAESAMLKQTIKYPGLVVSDQEVKIVSKGSGNISNLNFKVGDNVTADQVLAKIDSVDENPAKANYSNAMVAVSNALITKQNIANTYEQSYKSAQIAYDTAKIATQQAKIALDNRKAISGQSGSDATDNSDVVADTVAASAISIVDSINNITGFNSHNSVTVPYSAYLGALDQQTVINAKNSFASASAAVEAYRAKTFSNSNDKVAATYDLAKSVQALVNDTQILFRNTISNSALPQTSATGPSLSSLQGAVAGYQTQINGSLAQINGAKQALSNTGLNNNATLDSLQKAYELTQQQENAAAQNLNNVLAASKAQVDGAQTQIDALSGQANLARIQVDNLTIKAPIAGTITQKMISAGDTVAPGQVVAVMSQTAKLKIQTYVDQIYVNALQVGMPATISDNNGNNFRGIIVSISPSADATTKRFLVEVDFENEAVTNLPNPGIIVSLSFDVTRVSDKLGAIFLPITAVNVGQNESYIYVFDNGKAKKQVINVLSVDGENAQIDASGTLPLEAQIITSGNRLIKEGDDVTISTTTTTLNESK